MVSRNVTWILPDDELSYLKKWFGPKSNSDTWRSYGLKYNPAVGTFISHLTSNIVLGRGYFSITLSVHEMD